jgi:hypothetical protein
MENYGPPFGTARAMVKWLFIEGALHLRLFPLILKGAANSIKMWLFLKIKKLPIKTEKIVITQYPNHWLSLVIIIY